MRYLRRRFERCALCGYRFRWRRSQRSQRFLFNSQLYHAHCSELLGLRHVARDRFDVLACLVDVWAIDGETVRELMANRAADPVNASGEWDKAFRVFYDLKNRRSKAAAS